MTIESHIIFMNCKIKIATLINYFNAFWHDVVDNFSSKMHEIYSRTFKTFKDIIVKK